MIATDDAMSPHILPRKTLKGISIDTSRGYALTAEAYEGYRFVGWSIYGEMSYSFVEEASFTLVTKADERKALEINMTVTELESEE